MVSLPFQRSIGEEYEKTILLSIVGRGYCAGKVFAPICAHAISDTLYVTSSTRPQRNGTVFEYTPTGVQSTFATLQSRPRGLAFDSSGNLFVATNDFNDHGTIHKFTPNGTQSNFGGASGFMQGLAVDSFGNVFVTGGVGFTPDIIKFTPDGTRSIFASGLGQGFGLAFDSAGNLFAADAVNQTIFEYTPGGTQSTFVGPAAFGPNGGPIGLAFDSSGNLFVSAVGTPAGDTILEFTPGGTESTFATGLNNPRGIAFDSLGNLFVAEFNFPPSGDILEFTPGGTESVFARGNIRPAWLTFGPARGPAGANVPDSGSTFAILCIALVALESVRRKLAITPKSARGAL